jgi:transposase
MKKNKDIHKKNRDELDSTLEEKFMMNLQWSMLFFCFNHISSMIVEGNDLKDKLYVQKQFIKSWKKFVHLNITKTDLKIINDILSSPKNIFYSALQNPDEITESTEIYQEKYNTILNNIENFFLQTVKNNYNKLEDDSEDDSEDE